MNNLTETQIAKNESENARNPEKSISNRSIRTFVIRSSHITNAEKRNYEELSRVWTIPFENKITDFNAIFGNSRKLVIEIGFGDGKATAQIADENPETNYIAIDVYKAGIGKLLGEVRARNLKNLRVIEHDAIEVLEQMVALESVSAFHIFFPDPWPKKRHHKRRLICRPRTDLLAERLCVGGYIYFVTDWFPYAEFALEQLNATPNLKNKFNAFSPHQSWRPETKFEQKGIDEGRAISELFFEKIKSNHEFKRE